MFAPIARKSAPCVPGVRMRFFVGSIFAPEKAESFAAMSSRISRDVLEDFLSAAVGRVGLRAALFDALREELEAAGCRQVRVYVAVAEVDGLAFELRPAQVERGVFLQAFLSRSVVYAEGAEFFDYVQGERLL